MRILVAGGGGYLGSVLVPKLVERGYQVDVVDLLWFGNHLPEEVNVIRKDIFDLEQADLQGYEQVIFLAGLSNDPMAEYSPKDNFVQNASAPAYLGYMAKQAGARRYIYAGSCSVYGYTVNELYDENSPAESDYPYGISKLQGEYSAMQMQDDDFSVICFRQGTVSGYSPRMRLDLVVNTMFRAAMQNKTITVNNPSIWRPVLSIQDAASAYIRAIEASNEVLGIFNIASGNYTVGEIADLVKYALESELGERIKLDIHHMEDYRNYKVSYDKAIRMLSYKPMQDVPGIIHELIQNYDKFSDFSNESFYNIRVFKGMKERETEKI
jgi:nucleoside-diphosphate-sugar epimerase